MKAQPKNQFLSIRNTKMKSNPTKCIGSARAGALTSFILLACGPVFGATFTWDPANTTNGTTIDAGSGTWSLSAGNLWNNAGTNTAWAQTSATVPLHSAVFAGADGTHAINVGEAVATQLLTFSNSGYTLSAASALNIRVAPASGSNIISIASGKSATIGTNVSVVRVGAGIITGGGTLDITGTGATVRIAAGGNSMTVSGSTVNVGTGGAFTATSSMVVGNNSTASAVNVTGGTVTVTGEVATGTLALANNAGAGSAVFTLTSGAVTNNAISGGLRFGNTAANTSSSTFHLDGGILTVARVFEGEAGHASTFNFNGGTIKTRTGTTTAATFMEGIDTVNVRNGGAIFDTNGVNTTVGQALAHSAIGGDNAIDGGLTKDGPGTLTLTGTNTYTGTTTVNGGTLAMAGTGSIGNSAGIRINSSTTFDVTGSAASTVTLGATQFLTGTGTVLATGKTVLANGTLAPGNSPGALTQDGGSLQLGGGGDLNWQVHDVNGAAGAGYDTISLVNGATLDLSLLTSLNPYNINLWSLSGLGPDVNGNATGFNNTLAYSWTLFSTGSAIAGFDATDFKINVGAFNGTSGFSNSLGGGSFSVGLADGDTDLVLNFTPVPEPRAALLCGLGLLALLRRRRA